MGLATDAEGWQAANASAKLHRGAALGPFGESRLDPVERLQVGNPRPPHRLHMHEDVPRRAIRLDQETETLDAIEPLDLHRDERSGRFG
jgi:hypothetical protein